MKFKGEITNSYYYQTLSMNVPKVFHAQRIKCNKKSNKIYTKKTEWEQKEMIKKLRIFQ